MILGEHEAAQFRTKVPVDAGRQRRRDGHAVHRLPAFAAKIHNVRMDHQVLHNEIRVAFEADHSAGLDRLGAQPPRGHDRDRAGRRHEAPSSGAPIDCAARSSNQTGEAIMFSYFRCGQALADKKGRSMAFHLGRKGRLLGRAHASQ
jgi:hypothetical protein